MQVVLITGASSGIGAALAREYAARGAKVVLLARRKGRLEKLCAECGPDHLAIECDVRKDGDLERAAQATLARFGRIDTAIANAGFGVMGSIDRLTVEDYKNQFETNVYGVIRTIKAVIDPLRKTRGRFAIIGSVNGYVALPGTSAYAMSKFAVRALAESLMGELAHDGVSVTHVAPGFVESEIRVGRRGGRQDPVPQVLLLPAHVAARRIADAVQARRPEIVLTRHGKAGVFIQRHAPAFVRVGLRLVGKRVTESLDRIAGAS
jgi:short-subunit dehydrogenase